MQLSSKNYLFLFFFFCVYSSAFDFNRIKINIYGWDIVDNIKLSDANNPLTSTNDSAPDMQISCDLCTILDDVTAIPTHGVAVIPQRICKTKSSQVINDMSDWRHFRTNRRLPLSVRFNLNSHYRSGFTVDCKLRDKDIAFHDEAGWFRLNVADFTSPLYKQTRNLRNTESSTIIVSTFASYSETINSKFN